MVVILAWWMLLFGISTALPAYRQLGLRDQYWTTNISLPSRVLWVLAAAVPIALIVMVLLWWRASAAPVAARRWRGWTPGARRAIQLSGQANFADLLHTMLACRVPLDQALPLAADASGAAALEGPAAELAAQISAGGSLNRSLPALRRLPPLVRTAFLTGATEESVLAGLRRARDAYRERAAAWIADIAVLLPVAITLGLGAGVVGLYALLILQPYFSMLHEFAGWNAH
jgi:type II secretory pathway component PulF